MGIERGGRNREGDEGRKEMKGIEWEKDGVGLGIGDWYR